MATTRARRPYGKPHWNYRVMQFDRFGGGTWLAIHEVHYDEAGRPRAYGLDPAGVVGDTPHQLCLVLDRMNRAIGERVLRSSDFPSAAKD